MTKKIYLAGGCFWGVEKYLKTLSGVVDTTVGYANGDTLTPTYEDVCQRGTGHAETVEVDYDPEIISLGDLLVMFYRVIDPLTVNRQGPDSGVQYRSGVYYCDSEDRGVILESLRNLQTHYGQPLAVEVGLLENFYPAEDYHQDYLDKNPHGYCHIDFQIPARIPEIHESDTHKS